MLPQKPYYFLCSYPLGPGSIVQPGNWGRILKRYPITGPVWLPAREALFEQVRLKNFPEKPSRWDSIFLCENLEDARRFQKDNGRHHDLLYEVEVLDLALPSHRGDWQQLNAPQNGTIESILDMAQAYWTANQVANAEIMTLSEVKIISRH